MGNNCCVCSSNFVRLLKSPRTLICESCKHLKLLDQDSEAANYSLKKNRNFDKKIENSKNRQRKKILLRNGWSGGRVLEIGCAEGRLAADMLTRQVAPPEILFGVEPSADREISEKVFDRIYPNIRRLPRGKFDLIYSFHVLEHIENLQKELQIIHSLLDQGGVLVIEVPNQSGSSFAGRDFNPEHLHSFSVSSISILLENSNFIIQSLVTGAYESPVYDDGILIACKKKFDSKLRMFSRLKKLNLTSRPIVLAGLGNDYNKFIEPVLGKLKIFGVYDKNPKNACRKYKNLSLRDLQRFEGDILITSFNSGSAIKHDVLNALVPKKNRIVMLAELLEE